MRYHLYKGLAAETTRRICEVYGPNVLKKRVIRKWFARFRVGNFSVKDAERSDRPRTVDTDKITNLVDPNSHLKVREIQEILGMAHGNGASQR